MKRNRASPLRQVAQECRRSVSKCALLRRTTALNYWVDRRTGKRCRCAFSLSFSLETCTSFLINKSFLTEFRFSVLYIFTRYSMYYMSAVSGLAWSITKVKVSRQQNWRVRVFKFLSGQGRCPLLPHIHKHLTQQSFKDVRD